MVLKTLKNVVGILLLVCSYVLPSQVLAAPTSAEYGVVLNLSGKQRMLTQKMSKEVMLIALGIEAEGNLKNLAATSSLFDKTLKGLRNGDQSLGLPATEKRRILKQLDKIDTIWATFYPVIQQVTDSKSVSTDQIKSVASQNLPLLKEMNKAVGLYEKDAKKNGLEAAPGLAATINLAGKQRMLTQKMSKELFLIALGYEVEQNKLNLLETYTLFDRTLKGLVSGDETLGLPGTKQQNIVGQLDKVKALWADFMPIMEAASDYKTTQIDAAMLSKVAATNLPLLSEMNKAVKMYELEAAK